MARSLVGRRLMPQVISGSDGHDPEVPAGALRQARPVKLTGLQAAYSPGFPQPVAGEIRAGTEAPAMELDKPGVIIEGWLPDPALAGDGQFVDELFSVLASRRRRLAKVG
jgi:hypothetical protein